MNTAAAVIPHGPCRAQNGSAAANHVIANVYDAVLDLSGKERSRHNSGRAALFHESERHLSVDARFERLTQKLGTLYATGIG